MSVPGSSLLAVGNGREGRTLGSGRGLVSDAVLQSKVLMQQFFPHFALICFPSTPLPYGSDSLITNPLLPHPNPSSTLTSQCILFFCFIFSLPFPCGCLSSFRIHSHIHTYFYTRRYKLKSRVIIERKCGSCLDLAYFACHNSFHVYPSTNATTSFSFWMNENHIHKYISHFLYPFSH